MNLKMFDTKSQFDCWNNENVFLKGKIVENRRRATSVEKNFVILLSRPPFFSLEYCVKRIQWKCRIINSGYSFENPPKRKVAMCEQSKVDDVLTKWSSCNGWTLALIRFDIDGLVCGLPGFTHRTETVDGTTSNTRFTKQISMSH